jgi:hypothetical protein
VIPRISAPAGIDHIAMGVNPHHLQVFIFSQQCMDCGSRDRVVSAKSQHYLLAIIDGFNQRINFVAQVPKRRIKNMQILDMANNFAIFVIDLLDIAMINDSHPIVFLESLKYA